MLKPAYKIQIGPETFEPAATSEVISVRVSLDMDTPADSFEIEFGVSNRSSRIHEGDDASIQLGYEGHLVDVFKGAVDSVEPGISGIRVTGLNFMSKLLELRVNQVYENQTAGGIVSDLANKAGIRTEEILDGISFPMYVVDDGKNAYEHIRDLAEKCGFDVYMSSENKLVFKKYERREPHVLEYGKDIVQADLNEEKPLVAGVVVQGESPSSFKGADTSHWLTKRQVEGVSGSGAHLLIQDPTVKDKDTAEKVATAWLDALTRTLSGIVKAIGKAEVKLGDTVELKGMRNSKMNGEFQVRSVEQFLSKTEGFTTLIGWRK
jgi:prophage tail gpP-like protein